YWLRRPQPQTRTQKVSYDAVREEWGQVRQTTGIQYVTNETFHNSEAGKMVFPFIQTITDNFRFVSKGGSSNLAFSETLHLTITATGETAVTFDNARTYCQ